MGAENPSHYKSHPSGVECIQVIYPLHYGAGNAIKYVWRLGMKDEDLQELRKAVWYVKHCIDAGLESDPELLPFDSRQAFLIWAEYEPAGYRFETILYIYNGDYAKAYDSLVEWYCAITGDDKFKDVEVPSVHGHSWDKLPFAGGME